MRSYLLLAILPAVCARLGISPVALGGETAKPGLNFRLTDTG